MGAGEGMAAIGPYSHRVREEAFNLYCQSLSAEKIVRRIPEIFGEEIRPYLCTI